jgi:quercetin dioxygenase-like cupin family protein
MTTRRWAGNALAIVTWSLMAFVVSEHASAQHCQPVNQRIGDQQGCWILIDEKLGQLPEKPLFWHLVNYPTRADAESAKGTRGTVIEAFEKIWLSTIAESGWQSRGGTRVAEIGPIPGISNEPYTAHYMVADGSPGSSGGVHRHDGSEMWYTLTGDVCLETPDGMKVGHAGEGTIVPPGPPMRATTVGTERRRSLVLVLHDAAKPWSTPISEWTPKGLCKP